MALTKLEENLNVIENLPDSPTLEPTELKRKFDEGSIMIKDYINEVLTTEVDKLVSDTSKEIRKVISNEKSNILKNVSEQILADNEKKYYVGKLILDTKNVNPATYLGFGTWELWGSGRVPVGVNTEEEEFNEVEKTGGSKYLQKHCHELVRSRNTFGVGDYENYQITSSSNNSIYQTKDFGTGDSGNLQPYITCYIWKRMS